MSERVILITGTSSGIGLEAAVAFAKAGHRVYAGVRDPGKADKLQARLAEEKVSAQIVALDVLSTPSVEKAVERLMKEAGRMDVIVNNAGRGYFRTAEQATDDEVHALMDTNLVGNLRVVRAVLPIMRAQKSGHLIGVSSVGGLVGQPLNELYCASKFAVEGFYESLATYLKPYFNIDVSIIEPGGVSTNFVGAILQDIGATGGFREDAYKPIIDTYLAPRSSDQSPYMMQTPAEVAQVILQCASQSQPPIRMRTSGWAEDFCRHKTQADPDGKAQNVMVQRMLLGLK